MAAPRPKGNTRTNQADEFTHTDTVHRTRHEFDTHEKSDAARNLATVAPDAAGMDITDRRQRMGKTMTSQQLMWKLQKINPSFVFRVSESDPSKYGIFLPFQGNDIFGRPTRGLTHICGCENTGHWATEGMMPEFSIIDTVEETVPGPDGDRKREEFKAERRGWRTVLAILLTRRIITTGDVERHFGVVPSKESSRWMEIAMSPIELMSYQGVQHEGKVDEGRGDDSPRDGGRGDGAENCDQPECVSTGELDAQGDHGGAPAGSGDGTEGSGGETTP